MYSKVALAGALASLLQQASAQKAGNEDYWLHARASLHSPTKEAKRWDSSSPFIDNEAVSFSLDGFTYLSPTGAKFKSYYLASEWGLEGYGGESMPVTVMNVQGEVTCDTLGDKVAEFGKVDDVWNTTFLSALVLTTNSSFHVNSDVAGCLQGWGGSLIVKSGDATSSVSDIGLALVQGVAVPDGPYLAKLNSSGVTLNQVYRTYRDEAQAFTTAVLATEGDDFVDLTTPVIGLNTLSIPVPSRLYTYNIPNARPLEGRRIAVKDLFDIAGLKTGGGSRAYFNTYPPKTKTATAIQALINQGGIIVARAKTSQFANGEGATADWVDQMCPFNPRGDGYQQPSSSSSGPGAAIAAYDWIDYTIGSDTGGSITGPATNQGVFGMRPTWNAISLEGAIPLQATQDTAGFFTRDATVGTSFARGWYGDALGNYTQMPSTLILPNDSWTFKDGYVGAEQFYAFRDALVSYLAPSDISTESYDTLWNSTGYAGQVDGQTLDVYLNTTYINLIGYYQYENFAKPWIEDYQSLNEGRLPFIDPSPKARWAYANDNVDENEFNNSLAKKALFEKFVKEEVLISNDDTCTNAIYVYPYGLGTTSYRNIYLSPSKPPIGWGYPAQFAGVPQMVVPIGQVPYNSTITGQIEYLPLSVTMFAAAGCDYMLWDIAAALQESGAISAVATGRVGYPDRL